ncbi:hypothetical protein L915_17283 [Phytophthora nicotianae]|uniref:Ubiquitin-like protease family profile domain-containing protein n=2 Tax=Phytophthora nicotianae TaxID=4792 RepID=W2G034_PHYNI|nr:hypothetical protein L915_17283 [Phytophthora nicotianae]ETO64725.1 hypothetical protein F444_17790 [Phytophthora nicotianae P1976]
MSGLVVSLLRTAQTGYEVAQGFAYMCKPRQTNEVGCGIYMLRYLYSIQKHINEHKPMSILSQIESLVKGDFNSNKTNQARKSLLCQLSKTA